MASGFIHIMDGPCLSTLVDETMQFEDISKTHLRRCWWRSEGVATGPLPLEMCVGFFMCEDGSTVNGALDFTSCTVLVNWDLEYFKKFLNWEKIKDLNVSFMERTWEAKLCGLPWLPKNTDNEQI